MNLLKEITLQIKEEASRLGFAACGMAPAGEIDGENRRFMQQWLERKDYAGMEYMAGNLDKRMNPALLVEGAKSVISVALNYYPAQFIKPSEYQFAWYAYGEDYHTVMKDKLYALLQFIAQRLPDTEGRAFCDTAPLLERYWAWRCGLGWIGKNTQLIIPHAGSTFFLGELVINAELEYDSPQQSRCGNCTHCLEACPTHALQAPFRLNAARCLSYLTIENRQDIPDFAAEKMGNCIYGCDRCQQACPWNRFATPCQEPRLTPKHELLSMTREGWKQLSIDEYRRIFKGSAVKRAKYEGLMRNIQCVQTAAQKKKDELSPE